MPKALANSQSILRPNTITQFSLCECCWENAIKVIKAVISDDSP